MKKLVYLETTIAGYLTAKPCRDMVRMAHQQITREWWDQCRHEFDLYVSQVVLDEASKGDSGAAKQRLKVLQGVPLLPITGSAISMADEIIRSGLLTEKSSTDALHIAVATVHGMQFLMTWNCRHLANAQIMVELGRHLRIKGYEPPLLCTPEELMGCRGDEDD